MTRRSLLIWFSSFASLWALLTGSPDVGSKAQAADAYVLVAHQSVELTTLTRDRARLLLSGRAPRWPNGTPVLVVLPPRDSEGARWLSEAVLGMPETVYRRFLLEQVYRGSARAPYNARSLAEARSIVASTSGAVTALPRDLVPQATVALTISP